MSRTYVTVLRVEGCGQHGSSGRQPRARVIWLVVAPAIGPSCPEAYGRL